MLNVLCCCIMHAAGDQVCRSGHGRTNIDIGSTIVGPKMVRPMRDTNGGYHSFVWCLRLLFWSTEWPNKVMVVVVSSLKVVTQNSIQSQTDRLKVMHILGLRCAILSWHCNLQRVHDSKV